MGHSGVVWGGGIWQIIHVFSHKSAQDLTLVWIGCLLASELAALPRAIDSPYWVWRLCHVVSSVLVGILLAGVILYGG